MSKRIKDLSSPLSRWRKSWWARVSAPFARLSENQRFWIGFAALCILTTLLIDNPILRVGGEHVYREGDIAYEGINSPADIHFVDNVETERLKESSMESVRPTFTYEANRSDEAVQSFRSAWESLQRRSGKSDDPAKTNSESKNGQQWTGGGGAELGKIFGARKFSTNELDAVTRVLKESADGSIYGDQDLEYFQNEISLVDRERPNQQSVVQMPESSMTALSTARQKLIDGLKSVKSLSEREVQAFNSALSPLIQPSVVYDSVATDNARKAVAESVQPITISLKRGQKIADEGDIVTPEMVSQISAIRNYSTSTRKVNRFVGLFVLILGLMWAAWKFIEQRGVVARLALSAEKTFALFGFVIVVQTAFMAAFFKLADITALQNVRAPLNDPMIWAFAVPFATGSLLITLLADRPTAFFTGLFTSLLAGFIAPRGLEFTIYSFIASSVAVYGIGQYRSRQSVTIAGLLVGVVSALIALTLLGYTQQPFILNTVLLSVACALASGIAAAAITAVLLPICESLFGILTDVKLLELSNADLPVLGQLALRAPGTNQHSHAVGQLAEEACRVVGANGLLARIGALYHDIGKSAAPDHFVENQMGKNPHDRLKPVQSAKIIISHVTYGMKLGREMGLPQRIVDFIPQHHGTRTLHYFLKKAQTEARSEEDFSEVDFRYPGPKPQFKEAAIMMIADSCEAGARSLAEPNPENIRFIVTKIIDAILSDDQLDECDLTLRELTQIRESMIKSLIAIYHSRVDYPGYVPPNSAPRILIPADLPNSEDHGLKYADPEDIPVSKGGEIEDEAVDRSHQPNQATSKKA
ncbi:MAG: HDIG domain-containing metalloprotein [Pyrinomonadaceae bacterium]